MRLVAWISCASGGAAAAGVVFLAAMFASFAVAASSQALRVGRINDVLVMVSYVGYPIWAFSFGRNLLPASGRGVDTDEALGNLSARSLGDER